MNIQHLKLIMLGAVSGILLIMLVGLVVAPHLMLHEAKSPLEFEATVEQIISNAKAGGWVVPKIYNFQKSIIKHGLEDIGRLKVITLCKANYASQLLSLDKNKLISVVMPCSFAVYNKSDGDTYIASINVGIIGWIFGSDVAEIMRSVALEDQKILDFLS